MFSLLETDQASKAYHERVRNAERNYRFSKIDAEKPDRPSRIRQLFSKLFTSTGRKAATRHQPA